LWEKAKKALGDALDDAMGTDYGCWNCYFRAPAAEFRKLKRCPVCGTSFLTETEEVEDKDAFIETAKKLGIDSEGKTAAQIQDEILRKTGSTREIPQQPVYKEVYKEREIIREIVKIRCRNCGTPFEEKLNRCPHCGAPP
jgi:RNA polymerase subunit RPABC4/transcription elongation factor Spt4